MTEWCPPMCPPRKWGRGRSLPPGGRAAAETPPSDPTALAGGAADNECQRVTPSAFLPLATPIPPPAVPRYRVVKSFACEGVTFYEGAVVSEYDPLYQGESGRIFRSTCSRCDKTGTERS